MPATLQSYLILFMWESIVLNWQSVDIDVDVEMGWDAMMHARAQKDFGFRKFSINSR